MKFFDTSAAYVAAGSESICLPLVLLVSEYWQW